MVWAIGAAAGLGLLAGLLSLRVTFVALASLLTVLAGAAVTPAGSWPLWGILNIVAMSSALQVAYLVGYAVICALARAGGDTAKQQQPATEQLKGPLTAGSSGMNRLER